MNYKSGKQDMQLALFMIEIITIDSFKLITINKKLPAYDIPRILHSRNQKR